MILWNRQHSKVARSVKRKVLHEKDAVGKTRQSVDLSISVWKPRAWWPFTHNRSAKTDDESKAIKKHMNAVAEEPQRPSQEAI